MGPGQSIVTCLQKAFAFKGRASRSEYWWFGAFYALILVTPWLLWTVLTQIITPSGHTAIIITINIVNTLSGVLGLVAFLLLLPFFTAGWRRFHDFGWPGWPVLLWFVISIASLMFIPAAIMGLAACGQGHWATCDNTSFYSYILPPFLISGGVCVVFTLFLARPSQPGPNKYGPNPHEVQP